MNRSVDNANNDEVEDTSSFAFGQTTNTEVMKLEVLANWFQAQGIFLEGLDLRELKVLYDAVIAVGRVAEALAK